MFLRKEKIKCELDHVVHHELGVKIGGVVRVEYPNPKTKVCGHHFTPGPNQG